LIKTPGDPAGLVVVPTVETQIFRREAARPPGMGWPLTPADYPRQRIRGVQLREHSRHIWLLNRMRTRLHDLNGITKAVDFGVQARGSFFNVVNLTHDDILLLESEAHTFAQRFRPRWSLFFAWMSSGKEVRQQHGAHLSKK
jgi:hypothetical protein